jgi:hypothetical protein
MPPAKKEPVGIIAFCGTRGLPARYGGFETAVDAITNQLVRDGFECQVFCRRSSARDDTPPDVLDGRLLSYVNGSKRATLDTFVSSVQTGLALLRDRRAYAHVFWFNNANLPGILLTRILGIPMSVNTDGLEWRRAKWSWPFKAYYILSSALICIVCSDLISDSEAIQAYYRRKFLKRTTFIPYGVPPVVDVPAAREAEILQSFGLTSGRYLLQITRVEPDNLPVEIALAFQQSALHDDGFELLTIGYSHDTPYAVRLTALHGSRGVRVQKALYDPVALQVLRRHCRAYLHGNSVGGTNPALLEAMNLCPRVAAIDCEFNREVLAEAGWFFSVDNAASVIRECTMAPARGPQMAARIEQHYQWPQVADAYASRIRGM